MIPKQNLPPKLAELLESGEDVISLYQTPHGRIKYAVTTLRVINCMNAKNIRSCYYAKVYKIAMGYGKYINKILFFLAPNVKGITMHNMHNIFLMENISNAREAFKIVGEAWSKESPYMQRLKAFGNMATRHGLTLTTKQNNMGQTSVHISGKVDNLRVQVMFNNLQAPKQFTCVFHCPNPENHFLLLKKEMVGDALEKLFGKQDIQTQHSSFDKTFLLQGDNIPLIKYALTPLLKNQLVRGWKYLDGVIRMGYDKPEVKKVEEIKEFNIMDEKILHEFFPDTEIKNHITTPLIYQCNHLTKKLTSTNNIIIECIQIFNISLSLAKRISEYNTEE